MNANNQLRWTWYAEQAEAFGANRPNENPNNLINGVSTQLGIFQYHLRFPGQLFDPATGLSYNYTRDYNPRTGRYLESDLIGLAGGINTYGYVGGNPVMWVDPDGRFAVPFIYYGALGIADVLTTGAGYLLGGAGMAAILTIPSDTSLASRNSSSSKDKTDGESCPVPPPNDCQKEWDEAYAICELLITGSERNNWFQVGKSPPTLYSCAKGYVSQRCGGNRVY